MNQHETLSTVWESKIRPEMDKIAESTLSEYRSSLRIWERLSGNPPLDRIDRSVVREFREKLITTPFRRGAKSARKRSHATVNRIMRDVHAAISPLWPADRLNPDGLGLVPFFGWPRALQSQRDLPFVFTTQDLDRLYVNASAARQPSKFSRRTPLNDPRLWRIALVLALNCGARTWDLFSFRLSRINLVASEPYRFGSISFVARKTSKLHKIPLNECAFKHLKSYLIDPILPASDKLFPGFYKGASFYRTWKRICDAAAAVGTFESMRKTCVTRHNSVVWNAGFWLSGHGQTGVFGHYDNPSDRIFEAVYGLEQPAEFLRGAARLESAA